MSSVLQSGGQPPQVVRLSGGASAGVLAGEVGPAGGQRALADTYAVLLKEPDLAECQVAARLRCSEDAARAMIERLRELGLVRDVNGSAASRVIVNPLTAMQHTIAREREVLALRQQSLAESAEAFSSVLSACSLSARADQPNLGEHLPTLPELRGRVADVVSRARHSLYAMSMSPGDPPSFDALTGALDLGRVAGHATVRQIHPHSILFESPALAKAQSAAANGAEIRMLVRPPLTLVVVDEEVAVIGQTTAGRPAGGFVIWQETIVSAMSALFAKCWGQSHPLESTEARSLTAAELAVIQLLATGVKDDAIARQLGTSVRTIRRIVGNLMRRAGVGSRFAFGMWAAEQVAADQGLRI